MNTQIKKSKTNQDKFNKKYVQYIPLDLCHKLSNLLKAHKSNYSKLDLYNKYDQCIRFRLLRKHDVIVITNDVYKGSNKTANYAYRYYGRISIKNMSMYNFHIKTDNNTRLGIIHLLKLFLSAPEKYAKIYGDNTHHCMFCSKKLTNPISIYFGYGEICADNYSLPYNNTLSKDIIDRDIKEMKFPILTTNQMDLNF